MANNQQEESTKTFSVKMPTWAWQLLNIIAESREHGTNGNDLVKKCLEFIIESAKVSGPVPPEFQVLLDMLKLDTAWHGGFNFADAAARMDIAQVVLILQQHDDQGNVRKGFGLAMIDRPFMGDSRLTLCVDDILERVTEVATPGNYWTLREVGKQLDSDSIRETLTLLADAHRINHLNAMDRDELPKMGNFSDFGRAIEYGKKTKTKQHRTIDGEAMRQARLQFTDDDRHIADYEAKDWEGEQRNPENDLPPVQPFDVEW